MFSLDLNTHGHVLGLEILGAREHLPPALLQAILDHQLRPVLLTGAAAMDRIFGS